MIPSKATLFIAAFSMPHDDIDGSLIGKRKKIKESVLIEILEPEQIISDT